MAYISPVEQYEKEANILINAVNRHSRTPIRSALNLGCGGGHLDYYFKHAFRITGVDLSPGMLDLARRLNPEAHYVLGDMRSVRLGETFDAVFIGDSIAYMLSEDELLAAFETAAAHLNSGGVVCSYIELTPSNFQQNSTETASHTRDGISVTLVENIFQPDPQSPLYELALVYLIRQNGSVRFEVDSHLCAMYEVQIWLDVMRRAGFDPSVGDEVAPGIPIVLGRKLTRRSLSAAGKRL